MGFGTFAEIGVPARLLILTVGLLLGYAADLWLFDGLTESPAWHGAEWAGIAIPLLLILAPLSLPGWAVPASKPRNGTRTWAAMWVLCSIVLPWIIAWLMAGAAGRCSEVWWTQATSEKLPLDLLLAEYVVVWAVTYGVASVIGLLLILLAHWTWKGDQEQSLGGTWWIRPRPE